MICGYEKEIKKYLSGNLSEEKEAEVFVHAEKCTTCKKKLMLINQTDNELERIFNDFKFESNKIKIMESVKKHNKRISILSNLYRYRALASTIVAAIVLIISISVIRPILMNNWDSIPYVSTINGKSYKHFEIPDKIVIRNKGKIKEINSKDNIFQSILDETNKRFDGKLRHYSLAVQTKDFDILAEQEIIMEFVYNDFKNTDGRKYNRLWFLLSGEYEQCMFYDRGDVSSSGPVSNLLSPDDLQKLIKTINDN